MIEKIMVSAAELAGATVVTSNFHEFSPYGVSGVVVISESHLTVHTWPEHHYAAIDLFTCGDKVDQTLAFDTISDYLLPASSSTVEMKRGHLRDISASYPNKRITG